MDQCRGIDNPPPDSEADKWEWLPGLEVWVRKPDVDPRDVFERNPKWWQQKLDDVQARGFKEAMLPVLAYSPTQLEEVAKFVEKLSARGYHVKKIMLNVPDDKNPDDEDMVCQYRVTFPVSGADV